jgi:2-polyprenyl-6-methoxyphenol hydroxylase-like FAD-dependent oxidoreductase
VTGNAIVVGAGIGGLAAAIALRRAGWEVEVFERAATPGELGFALLLAPNAMRALRALGLADRIIAGGAVAEHGEIRRADGNVLKRIDFRPVRDRLGEPSVTVLRAVLHGALLETVGPAALRLGSPVATVTSDAEGAAVKLASGEVRRARLVVGADGVQSVVRKTLHADEPAARWSGLIALRGLVRGMPDLGAAVYYGRGCEAGTSPAGSDAVYWFISARADHPGEHPTATGDPRALLDQLHEPFRALVARTDARDLRLDALMERASLAHWGTGPVTLLGDAAHPMLPHAGQGAAQALEDAVALGHALAAATDVEAGLRAYERARMPRTAAIAALARRNARIAIQDSSLTCALRNIAIRLVPDSLMLRAQIDLARA